MKRSMTLLGISLVLATCWSSPTVRAFCGFYVAKADAKLFNQASQVVLVRHDDKTVITMANDFQGDPTEFARAKMPNLYAPRATHRCRTEPSV